MGILFFISKRAELYQSGYAFHLNKTSKQNQLAVLIDCLDESDNIRR